MHVVDLQVQRKVVSAYEVAHNNSSDNDLTKLGGQITAMYGKEALQTGGWSTAAPVPRFQTLDPDWSTSPDMSRLPL
ncbi:hypothetical protein T11_3729 [Trichinella zimbabwensis]|uniref:Uncharacterized protein n=1 Tax=Trichinella zimbabwensis TaxID=268475 RepID=A0A0V1HFM9_9BILA|nr:hypothetical protein T11_3729 [Trichinella zimbabwensis]